MTLQRRVFVCVNMNTHAYRFIFYLVFITSNIYSKAVEDLDEELQAPDETSINEVSTEPQINTYNCSENEEFVLCKSCERTCDGRNTSCVEPCSSGCFCNLFRDVDGKCISYENCSCYRKESSDASSTQSHIPCGLHQEFNACRRCEKSCSNPNPSCVGPCSSGCFCIDGYVLASDGRCVELHKCPKEVFSEDVFFGHEVSIEECSPDEVFVQCGWCEGSCSAPTPLCAPACTRGCVCRPPLLRHHSGNCVLEEDCKPHKCPSIKEEFVCQYGCESRCEARPCARTRRCRLGCHCKLGLFRDVDGQCVEAEQCSNYGRFINNK